MPAQPPTPDPPFLAGTTPDQKYLARGPDYIRIAWTPVAGHFVYDVQVGGGAPLLDQQQPLQISGLAPAMVYSLQVRARDSGSGQASNWSNPSDPKETLTRPPTPGDPHLVAMGSVSADFTIGWNVDPHYSGGVQIKEKFQGVETIVLNTGPLTGQLRRPSLPYGIPRTYFLMRFIPQGGSSPIQNESFWSTPGLVVSPTFPSIMHRFVARPCVASTRLLRRLLPRR
jgi:hypothetical protein